MRSHPFDLFAQALARGISRRDLLRALGGIAAGAAVYVNFPRSHAATAHSATLQGAQEPEPPGFPFDPTGLGQELIDYIDDYVDCIAEAAARNAGKIGFGDPVEECDKAMNVSLSPPSSWCEIRDYLRTHDYPNLNQLIQALNEFGDDCGTIDCLQCCYVPKNNGCHSSFIGETVINCSPGIYGVGTRGVGLTLLLAEPTPGETCLFTPQTCSHVALCLPPPQAAASSGGQTLAPAATPPNYLTDPRAIKQRARIFASYALVQARHYIDEYATDTPDALPLQSLNEAVLGRGWATWRQDIAGLNIDLNDPLFRATDSHGNLMPSPSLAKVGREFATMRLLTGLPNLAARFQFVESKVWSDADKASYLAATPDPDATLADSLHPHIIGILKRMPNLQDYKLLAVPLADEPLASGLYGGMALGQPPTLLLSATVAGLTVTLTATLTDPTDGVGGLARPLALDWGDGRTTRAEFTVGQAILTLTHEYAAGRYAIYGVAANNSGLRGAACVVVEAVLGRGRARTSADDAVSALPTIVRAGLTGLTILNLPFTSDLQLGLFFTDVAGTRFRAGRSRVATGPTNITLPVALGDAYAHNPSRLGISKLRIEPRHGITTASGGRITALTLSTLLLGVFSTAQMRVVEKSLALRAEMLAVYLEGDATPLPSAALTTNTDGSITVPLLYRASSAAPWQRIERIEVALTPDLLDGFVLDVTPTPLPVGTNASWVEKRPGAFTRVVDAPPPTPTSTPPTSTPTGAPEPHKLFLPLVDE